MNIFSPVLRPAARAGSAIGRWTFESSPPADLVNSSVITGLAADVGAGAVSGFDDSAAADRNTPQGNGSANVLPEERLHGFRRISPESAIGWLLCLVCLGCATMFPHMTTALDRCSADFDVPLDSALQARLETLDADLRQRLGMAPEQTAAGVLDLRTGRLALVRPDRIDYAASLPKIGILLAYFVRHPEAATRLDPVVRHELGLVAKASSNELAAKYSRELGLRFIQQCLNERGFYDPARGGGLWVGKHYGQNDERYPDPVGGHSHAATVRQVLRYFLLLEQDRLISPAASQTLREIFASHDIPHDRHKFVLGLAGRPVELRRKWGEWENWQHDAAVVTGPGRHYVVVALTQHPRGDDYLVALAATVDDWMAPGSR